MHHNIFLPANQKTTSGKRTSYFKNFIDFDQLLTFKMTISNTICIKIRYGSYIYSWHDMHLADILSKSLGRSHISVRNITYKSIKKNQTDSGRGEENEIQDIFLILIHFLLLSPTRLTSFEQLNPIHVVHLSISTLISYCKAAKQWKGTKQNQTLVSAEFKACGTTLLSFLVLIIRTSSLRLRRWFLLGPNSAGCICGGAALLMSGTNQSVSTPVNTVTAPEDTLAISSSGSDGHVRNFDRIQLLARLN